MLIAEKLERTFVMIKGLEEIPLSDPERSFEPKAVLNFYAATYPVLTTATIEGPEIIDDKVHYKFVSTIGTKG